MNNRRLLGIIAPLATLAAGGSALAQQDPPQWNSGTTYIGGGLVRASNGNFYRCLKNNSAHDPTADPHTYWELFYVRSNLTLTIAKAKATFPTLKQAWAMVQSAKIAGPAMVTIQINSAGGVYTEDFTTALNLNQPDGQHIIIQGDIAQNVILNFHSASNGFSITNAHAFGGLRTMTLDGNGANPGYQGVDVEGGSTLGYSPLTIRGFQYGVEADVHSTVNVVGSAISFTQYGVHADNSSFVNASNANISGGGVGPFGIAVETGSTVNANAATVKFCTTCGIYASMNSTIQATNAIADTCHEGFISEWWSTIVATASTSKNNDLNGYDSHAGGHIYAMLAVLSNNAHDFNIPVNTSATDQSYIAG